MLLHPPTAPQCCSEIQPAKKILLQSALKTSASVQTPNVGHRAGRVGSLLQSAAVSNKAIPQGLGNLSGVFLISNNEKLKK